MDRPSQKFAFDNRLLEVEELFRQRSIGTAIRQFDTLNASDFEDSPHQNGLFLLLAAEKGFAEGNYRTAIEHGLKATRVLADFPLNRQYGRVQLVLSKSYSAIGDLKNAEIRAHNSLASYRRAADHVGQVNGLNELARIAFIRADFDKALGYLDEAIEIAGEEPRKVAQLTGNAGTIRMLAGLWKQAEQDLNTALEFNTRHKQEISQAVNLLSLGYLHIRKREFVFAARHLDRAHEIISRLNLKRERVIYLEYMGEMAFERGDIFKAKATLSDAYQEGRMLAPESSLVSQASRRLADVELALDNHSESMKHAQKALELAQTVGEKAEVGASFRAIARIFAERGEFDDALTYIRQAVETLQHVGDPLELARTMLVQVQIKMKAGLDDTDRMRQTLDDALRIFRRLELEYWIAETDHIAGVLACQVGDLARGFKHLSRAERSFTALAEKGKVRAVNQFLRSLADSAVAVAVSDQNEFKVFGNLVSPSEMKELKMGRIEETLDVLIKRTRASRAIIYTPDFYETPVVASKPMTELQAHRFAESFSQLLGEEVAQDRPTLLLDCRRDPYINDLFGDIPDPVASVIVVPFKMSDKSTSYLYLDRTAGDNSINPFSQPDLNFTVGFSDLIAFKAAELQKMKLLEDNRRLKDQLKMEAAFPNIITRSSRMLEMLAQVRQVVDSSISISIEGETGSGKDLLARAIHYNSVRRDKRFISVNCAALPETLLESELFGYRRGAFTGADRDKAGLFEEANGGTFFLDEIADMPLGIQAKILRVLEEKEIVRLGETSPRKVDVRIISATNKSLREEIERGTFRHDLYYRLSALTFRLPPLRDRKEDIPLLVEHFLRESGKSVSPTVMKCLVAYDWPGNVRELDNEIKKLILLTGDAEEISSDTLSSKIAAALDADQIESAPDIMPVSTGIEFTEEYSLYDYLAEHERQFIIKALRDQKGVKKHAAALLKIPESTLRLKIKQYNIDLNQIDSIH
ncbi:MAG: sigma 54-interacting transcriptional regulator [candidate division Zixibacteria bacterium]|jgi:transcriptional regulator with GAF, ATPase, and Fis domain|nr:sigma 54-interacting transcriptional regulator [candidate division Zixibacteria bacterium]